MAPRSKRETKERKGRKGENSDGNEGKSRAGRIRKKDRKGEGRKEKSSRTDKRSERKGTRRGSRKGSRRDSERKGKRNQSSSESDPSVAAEAENVMPYDPSVWDESDDESIELWEFKGSEDLPPSRSYLVMRADFGEDGSTQHRDVRDGTPPGLIKDAAVPVTVDSPSPGRLEIDESGWCGSWRAECSVSAASEPAVPEHDERSERGVPSAVNAVVGSERSERDVSESKSTRDSSERCGPQATDGSVAVAPKSVGKRKGDSVRKRNDGNESDASARPSELDLFSDWDGSDDSPPVSADQSAKRERENEEKRGTGFDDWDEFDDSPPVRTDGFDSRETSGKRPRSPGRELPRERKQRVKGNRAKHSPSPGPVVSRRRVEIRVRSQSPGGGGSFHERDARERKGKLQHAAVSHRELSRLIKRTRIGYEVWDKSAVISYPTGVDGFVADVEEFWRHRREDRRRLNLRKFGDRKMPFYRERTDLVTARDLASANTIVRSEYSATSSSDQPAGHVRSSSREANARAGTTPWKNSKERRKEARRGLHDAWARSHRDPYPELDEINWGIADWEEFDPQQERSFFDPPH